MPQQTGPGSNELEQIFGEDDVESLTAVRRDTRIPADPPEFLEPGDDGQQQEQAPQSSTRRDLLIALGSGIAGVFAMEGVTRIASYFEGTNAPEEKPKMQVKTALEAEHLARFERIQKHPNMPVGATFEIMRKESSLMSELQFQVRDQNNNHRFTGNIQANNTICIYVDVNGNNNLDHNDIIETFHSDAALVRYLNDQLGEKPPDEAGIDLEE